MVGTPRYMSPEQVQGRPVEHAADLFSLAVILFEMLTGRHAFGGTTPLAVYHALLYEQPPALGGSPAIAAVDRVVRRGLAKGPQERFPSAAAMAQELRLALLAEGMGQPARAIPITRLIVLPFRILRPDPDTDFLAFSLPDAITSSFPAWTPSSCARASWPPASRARTRTFSGSPWRETWTWS